MEEIRPVDVQDMLHARDERVLRQQDLIRRHAAPLISFTMNIAGSIKNDALIRRAFQEGASRIRAVLHSLHLPVLEYAESMAFTGCEALWAVRAEASVLKARMCAIEEADALGRLFDIDVIDPYGRHLSRETERRCLICGGPVRACARSRTHSAEELYHKAHAIIQAFLDESLIRRTGMLAEKALLYEALTTPKPGLVDCENNGSHQDMDLFSFAASACALRPWLEQCVRLGQMSADISQLQLTGMLAEEDMLQAACANTHKGAIFTLGLLCYAAGKAGESADPPQLLSTAAGLGRVFLDHLKTSSASATGGEQQYRAYGLTGARGEAADCFQNVLRALSVLQREAARGKSLPEAGVDALLLLMAHVMDSNIIRRCGMQAQQQVMEQAAHLIQNGYTASDLRALNAQFVQMNASPGGAADLLAAAYFLYFWAA